MYTVHAEAQMKKRGIPRTAVDLVLDYGEKTYARRGGELYYLGNSGRKRIRRDLGRERARRLEPFLRTAAIVKDGWVITCVKWYRRIRRG